MPLKTLVKVGSLTHLSDARYCAGMGVNMLGFKVIAGEPDYLTPTSFQEIRGWITGPAIVAEVYGLRDPSLIADIIREYKPDYFELGTAELDILDSLPLPYILSLHEGETMPDVSRSPAYVMVRRATEYTNSGVKLIVDTNTPEEATDALEFPNVHGLAMKGGKEISPGLKDYDALASVLELLEEEG